MTIKLDEETIVKIIQEKLDKDSVPYKKDLLGQFVANKIAVAKSISMFKKKQVKTTITRDTINGWANLFAFPQESEN